MKSSRSKKIVDFVIGLLGLLKWLPLGKYKEIVVVLGAVLGTVSGLLSRCESKEPDQTPTPAPTTSPSPQPTSTPVHTPTLTPSPTPRPPRIIIDRAVVSLHPFTVRYTAPFEYNTHLWADKWRLGAMGRDVDGNHILYAVVLNTPGKRRLMVKRDDVVLAEKWVEVK